MSGYPTISSLYTVVQKLSFFLKFVQRCLYIKFVRSCTNIKMSGNPDIPHLSKAIFDLKCSPLKFTKRVDYKNLQQLQLGSSRLNSRNG